MHQCLSLSVLALFESSLYVGTGTFRMVSFYRAKPKQCTLCLLFAVCHCLVVNYCYLKTLITPYIPLCNGAVRCPYVLSSCPYVTLCDCIVSQYMHNYDDVCMHPPCVIFMFMCTIYQYMRNYADVYINVHHVRGVILIFMCTMS